MHVFTSFSIRLLLQLILIGSNYLKINLTKNSLNIYSILIILPVNHLYSIKCVSLVTGAIK
jgi:hypothetical protein